MRDLDPSRVTNPVPDRASEDGDGSGRGEAAYALCLIVSLALRSPISPPLPRRRAALPARPWARTRSASASASALAAATTTRQTATRASGPPPWQPPRAAPTTPSARASLERRLTPGVLRQRRRFFLVHRPLGADARRPGQGPCSAQGAIAL